MSKNFIITALITLVAMAGQGQLMEQRGQSRLAGIGKKHICR